MNTSEKNNIKETPKKTVYKEKEVDDEQLNSGQTSSASSFDRTDFSSRPARSNKPLGANHEPGTMPGSE